MRSADSFQSATCPPGGLPRDVLPREGTRINNHVHSVLNYQITSIAPFSRAVTMSPDPRLQFLFVMQIDTVYCKCFFTKNLLTENQLIENCLVRTEISNRKKEKTTTNPKKHMHTQYQTLRFTRTSFHLSIRPNEHNETVSLPDALKEYRKR